MTPPARRVTRGFSMEDEEGGEKPVPRRVRTRQQIMKGEGKRPPAAVELRLLAHNPFNPRSELTDIEETASSLRAKGQIQPVTVVRREAFLRAHPGREGEIGEPEYVVVDGNRRLAAARAAELAELRIDVNDELAASSTDILESALIANIHRVDVPPLEQAQAIRELAGVHGSQAKVAQRLGKTAAWVSQRLALLELTPELQEKVESGELKVEPARRIGRLPKEEQAAEAEKALNSVKPPRQRSRHTEPDAPEAESVNGVNASGAPVSSPAWADRLGEGEGAGSRPSPSGTINGVNGSGTDAEHILVPRASPQQVVEALVTHLSPPDLLAVTELLVGRVGTPDAEVEQSHT
ncbi:ParB/RepB/Spo0J family partition protein [Streptomyces alkaliphilus]|uniref:ParB/RepB/Spo0J family partition protein n=1 Tax=Streptomyces alkaliphilus TaxID=1472722 RepID=A0A7W3Y2G5_9ACTN|nr:ParB/RepB/Spo0J family partition protein [Streptomyces alkaliphilus]MBB0245518.1 ParB/RepB/Spo0J family partition protein [Streptomyces alkaliphilus]